LYRCLLFSLLCSYHKQPTNQRSSTRAPNPLDNNHSSPLFTPPPKFSILKVLAHCLLAICLLCVCVCAIFGNRFDSVFVWFPFTPLGERRRGRKKEKKKKKKRKEAVIPRVSQISLVKLTFSLSFRRFILFYFLFARALLSRYCFFAAAAPYIFA